MNTFIEKLRSNKSGFTIIEVMIVLALAGLIIAAVIVAVPQLQRNQRNAARRGILSRIKSEVDSFSGNNNGAIPSAAAGTVVTAFGGPVDDSSFFDRYFECTGAAATRTCAININDPQTGMPVGLTGGGATATSFTAAPGLASGSTPGSLNYTVGTICSGEVTTATNANARNYSLQLALEGGAVYCLDNK